MRSAFGLPYSHEDEMTVLAGVLHIGATRRDSVGAMVKALPLGFTYEAFHTPGFGKTWAAAIRMIESGGALDFQTMREETGAAETQAAAQLATLYKKGQLYVDETFRAAAYRVFRDWRRRNMLHDALAVAASCSADTDIGRSASLFSAKAQQAVRGSLAEAPGVFLDDVVSSVVDQLEAFADGGDTFPCIQTGLRSLDNQLGGGLEHGAYAVVAARPGVGKTAFADTIAGSAMRQGYGVFWANMEMPNEQLARRRMSAETADVGGGVLSHSQFKDRNIVRENIDVFRAMRDLRRPLVIANSSIRRVSTLLQSIDHVRYMLKENYGVPLGLVVVDYLQIMESDEDSQVYRNRALEVAAMSRDIRAFCRTEKITALILSQLNRSISGRPDLTNLRESGSIEQDADIVMMLRRDEMDAPPTPHAGVPRDMLTAGQAEERRDWDAKWLHLKGLAQIDFKKNRNGPIGEVEVRAHLGSNRFYE